MYGRHESWKKPPNRPIFNCTRFAAMVQGKLGTSAMFAHRSIMFAAAAMTLGGLLSTPALAQIVTPLVIPAPAQPAAPKPGTAGATAAASYTQEQFNRGAATYAQDCVTCHGPNLNDGEFGGAPLTGNAFKAKYFGTTVDGLFGFMSSAMPPGRAGQLTPQEYADLTAYIIGRNGLQPGSTELPSDLDALAKLSLP
jgi:mono/diheme cytochrome c family protein